MRRERAVGAQARDELGDPRARARRASPSAMPGADRRSASARARRLRWCATSSAGGGVAAMRLAADRDAVAAKALIARRHGVADVGVVRAQHERVGGAERGEERAGRRRRR